MDRVETVYCPVGECERCAGIGEVMTDSGVRECTECQGAGHRPCQARALFQEIDRLRRRLRLVTILAVGIPVINMLALAGLVLRLALL